MRILITTDTIGGVWTFTRELALGLLEHGDSILLVSFGRAPSASQSEECDQMATLHAGRFQYVASEIPLEWMSENGRAWGDGSRLLGMLCDSFGPDVLHTNQFCYGALDVSVPCVVTAHSDVLSWARACRRAPLPDSQWLRQYEDMVQSGLLGADTVIAPTRWMLSALAESFTLPERTQVIPNGRCLPPPSKGHRELRAVTAGRLWDEAKDLKMLGGVICPIPVVVAGETRHEQANANGHVGDAEFIGHLSEQEMIDLLQHSSIYLCLSIYEPFGLAPLEAALCGCAVLARDIPSLREVWGSNVLYFNSAEALSRILDRLATDPFALESARQQALSRAVTFTRENMVKQYSRTFRRAAVGSGEARHVA